MNENKNENQVKTQPEAKKNKKSIPKIIVLILCIGVFAFSVVKIGKDIADDSETENAVDDLKDFAGRNDNDKDSQSNNGDNENSVSNDQNSQNSNQHTSPNDDQNSNDFVNNDNQNENNNNENKNGDDENNENLYDDQTADEAKDDHTQNSIISVTRPGASLDKTDLSVIHPNNIKTEDIAYLSGIDFSKLKDRNSDTVAWICIPGNDSITGLPVDTAVVQTTDNYFYLSHSFDKSENVNGWIYADYRNDMEHITANYNTVIYGHARSYRMFGGLKNLNETPEWYKNGYNHFIKISTPNDETIWQIFSWHETNVYYDYIRTEFENSEDFINFATELQDKNELKGYFSTFEFTENSRIITLSTCKGSNPANRVAVHAVLVARNPLN